MSESKGTISFLYHPNDKTQMEAISMQLSIMHTEAIPHVPVGADLTAIKTDLTGTKIVIVPLSIHFLASAMPLKLINWLFEAKGKNQIHIFPILLGSCPFQATPFKDLIPADTQPITGQEESKWTELQFNYALKIHTAKDDILKQLEEAAVVDDVVVTENKAPSIAQSFFYLNYEKQKEEIENVRVNAGFEFPTVNAFLLRGTENCGHELLVRSFINFEGLKKVEFNPYSLRISTPDKTRIWDFIHHTLGFGQSQLSKEAIAKKIIKKLKNTHIVLVFNEVQIDREKLLEAINFFLPELKKLIQDQKETNLKHFFIFVNDQKIIEEEEMKKLLSEESLVQTLSPISPIAKKDLIKWVKTLKRDSNLTFKSFSRQLEPKIKDILPDDATDMYVADVVKKVLEVTQLDKQIGTIEKITDLWQKE